VNRLLTASNGTSCVRLISTTEHRRDHPADFDMASNASVNRVSGAQSSSLRDVARRAAPYSHGTYAIRCLRGGKSLVELVRDACHYSLSRVG